MSSRLHRIKSFFSSSAGDIQEDDRPTVEAGEADSSRSFEQEASQRREELESIEARIAEKSKRLEEIESELDSMDGQIADKTGRLETINQELERQTDRLRDVSKKLDDVKAEQARLTAQLDKTNDDLDLTKKKLAVAGLSVNRSTVAEERAHKARMEGLQQEEEGLEEEAKRIEREEERARGQVASLEREVRQLETKLHGRDAAKAPINSPASHGRRHGASKQKPESSLPKKEPVRKKGIRGSEQHFYSEQDIQYLIDNYGKATQQEMADHLGVSRKSVEHKVHSLRQAGQIGGQGVPSLKAKAKPIRTDADVYQGLQNEYGSQDGAPRKASGRFTPEEEELIATYYGTVTSGDLGRLLGRPPKTIQKKAQALIAKGWMLPAREKASLDERRSLYREHHVAASWDDAERQRKRLRPKRTKPRVSTTDIPGSSRPEIVLYYYVRLLFPDAISRYQYVDQDGVIYEADIYIPSASIAIEYDGGFWHEGEKQEIDNEKDAAFTAAGIYTIRVRDEGLPELSEFYGETIINKRPNGARSDAAKISHMVTTVIRRLGEIIGTPDADRLRAYELTEEQYEADVPEHGALLFTKRKHPNVTDYLCGKYWDEERNAPLDPTHLDRYSSIDAWFDCPNGRAVRCNVKDHMALEDSRSAHSILNYCPFQGDPGATGCDRTCAYWRESNKALGRYYAGAYPDEELDATTKRRASDPFAMFMIIKAMYGEAGGLTDLYKGDFISEPREVPNGFVLPEFPSFRDLQIEGPEDLGALQRFFDDTRFWNIRVNLDILEHDEEGRDALAAFLSHRLERDLQDAEYYAETYKLSEDDDRHLRAPFEAKRFRYDIGGGLRFIRYSFHMSGEPGEVPTVTKEFKPVMVDIFKHYSVAYEEDDGNLYLTASSSAAYHQRLWAIEHKFGRHDKPDAQAARQRAKDDRPREVQRPQTPHKTAKGWNVLGHTFIAAYPGCGRTYLTRAIIKRLHDEGTGAQFIIIDNKGVDYAEEEKWPETIAYTGWSYGSMSGRDKSWDESYAAIKQAHEMHAGRLQKMEEDDASEWDGPAIYLVIDQIGPLAPIDGTRGARKQEWEDAVSMLADIALAGSKTHVVLVIGSSIIDKKTTPSRVTDLIPNKVVFPVSRMHDVIRYLGIPGIKDNDEYPSIGHGYVMTPSLDHAQLLDDEGILKALGV